MSTIRMYRVNGFDITDSTEFYFKIGNEDRLLCSFCVADESIYYYRRGSKIISPKENARTRYTTDGFLSMEDLKDLFEMLRRADLASFEGGKNLKISRHGKKVIIEAAPPEAD